MREPETTKGPPRSSALPRIVVVEWKHLGREDIGLALELPHPGLEALHGVVQGRDLAVELVEEGLLGHELELELGQSFSVGHGVTLWPRPRASISIPPSAGR